MKARLLLLASLLLAPAFSGCAAGAQAATAQEQADPASERARAWADDAELASAVGVEGSFVSQFEGYGVGRGEHWERAQEDGEVGDGRCKVWRYVFVADSKPDEVHVVVVDDEGQVLANHTDDRDGDDRALGDWNVDSDEALEAAREASPGLESGVDSDHYGIVMQLDRDPDRDNPTWFVAGGGGDSSGGGGFALVDAVTGEVLESGGGGGGGGDYRP